MVTAQQTGCPVSGIVPGSVTVTSTNNEGGQTAGHVIQFQLCAPLESRAMNRRVSQPDKIRLLWEGFSLDEPGSAGITLTEVGGARSWNATTEISSYTRLYSEYYLYGGVAVEFPRADLSDSISASADVPLTLQFNVPVSAGMSNPSPGEYRWQIVFHHYLANSCKVNHGSVTSPVVPAYIPGELQLFPRSGAPGTVITVIGNGFPALASVQVTKIGSLVHPSTSWYEPPTFPEVTTDSLGAFELKIVMPGLESGPDSIQVQVGGKTVSAEVIVHESRVTNDRIGFWVEDAVADLGDNFVRSFHYNAYYCEWTFYDPRVPYQSTQHYFLAGQCYWVLVKEPAEVVLHGKTRNLTCAADGNCWNQIVW